MHTMMTQGGATVSCMCVTMDQGVTCWVDRCTTLGHLAAVGVRILGWASHPDMWGCVVRALEYFLIVISIFAETPSQDLQQPDYHLFIPAKNQQQSFSLTQIQTPEASFKTVPNIKSNEETKHSSAKHNVLQQFCQNILQTTPFEISQIKLSNYLNAKHLIQTLCTHLCSNILLSNANQTFPTVFLS